jgi:hypothetical protein
MGIREYINIQRVLMAIIKKPILYIILSFINFLLSYWLTEITNTDKYDKMLTISEDSFLIYINLFL